MNQLLELTPEKLNEIYSNEKLRNDVAFAHGCLNSRGEFLYKKTCSYPVEYKVTDEQIKIANEERLRAKQQTIKDNEGKLMFVGMGMTYEPRYEDDVCNHRVRTEFMNSKGRLFFIEFGTGSKYDEMRIDHAIDRDLENKCKENRTNDQPYNNYKGLERMNNLPKYTKRNILNFVNSHFDCNFKEIVIDNYNVSPSDFISVSPKN